jgi:hypothetical protein
MPLSTILGPVRIDGDFVVLVPHITALSNGSFAVTYLDVAGQQRDLAGVRRAR